MPRKGKRKASRSPSPPQETSTPASGPSSSQDPHPDEDMYVLSMTPENVKSRERYAAQRQQKTIAREEGHRKRLDRLKEVRLHTAKEMRQQLQLALQDVPDPPTINDVRSFLRLLTELRHDADEVHVEPSVITAALEQLVRPNNFTALFNLAQSPLKFRPQAWPDAFHRGGQAFLYLREDLAPISKTLSLYQQRFPADSWYAYLLQAQADHEGGEDTFKFVKYPGQTMAPSLQDRLQVDDDNVANTRRANWDRVRREVVKEGEDTFSIWGLKYVTFPDKETATEDQDQTLAFRMSPVAQEMERILIAATGFASIGSAIGGLHYPWKTSIYEELTTSVLKHMQLRAQMYSASSTQPTTPTPVFTNDMRERILKLMRDFLRQLEDRKRLQKGQGAVDDVGSVITGTRLAQVEDYASSMATGLPTSITVMKDITVEEVRSSDPQLTYFGRAAGPGPRLSMDVHRAIDTTNPPVPNQPADAEVWPAYLWRIFLDFWWAILQHVLVSMHVAFLLSFLKLTAPRIVRVESAKVAALFAHGMVLNPDSVVDIDWQDLPLQAWIDRVCDVLLLNLNDAQPSVVILSLHPGAVKYDPVLATLRTRLFFLAVLMQRGAEILVQDGRLSALDVRNELVTYQPLQEEIARVRNELRELQAALFGLRGGVSELQPSISEHQSLSSSRRVQQAHERHKKAEGAAFSAQRMDTWNDYVGGAPREVGAAIPYFITKNTAKLPCPGPLAPFSEEHRLWFLSRKEGTDLVIAASQYGAARRDPDEIDGDFDEVRYFRQRSQAATTQKEKDPLKLVVSPVSASTAISRIIAKNVKDPVYFCCCRACGLSFLGDRNTQHRCTSAINTTTPIQKDDKIERDIQFTLADVVDRCGVEPLLDSIDAAGLLYIDISAILEASNIWNAFRTFADQHHPAQLAELEARIYTDPRPFLLMPQESVLPGAAEYDALLWSVTVFFTIVYGERSSSSTRIFHRNIEGLLPVMQADLRQDAIADAVCALSPRCSFSSITHIKKADGTQRPLQHDHPTTPSSKTKGPIELVSFRRSVSDLPIEYVRELIFTEGTKSPYSSDGQSCLLWGLSEEPNAFRHVRPLLTSRPGAETLSVEGPAKRSRTSFDHIDADTVAKHMNENGLLPLSARRVLSEQFEISREQLNYYIRGQGPCSDAVGKKEKARWYLSF